MSRIKVDRITDKAGTGAPTLVNGMNVTGKSTMGDIVGAAATFNSINAGGDVTFGANVSIGGTLTYEDVKNVDSVGLITARTGIKVTAGGIDVTAGDVDIINGSVGVGLNNPGLKLHIQDGALPSAPAPNGNCDVVIEGTTNTGIQFLSGGQTQLRFGDADSTAAGAIIYKHTDDNFKLNFSNSGYLSLNDGGGENLRFTPNNEIGIGGANYGTSGQVLTSGGSGSAVQWTTPEGGVWQLIDSTAITSNISYHDISFGANAGITTSFARFKIYYNVWLNGGDKFYIRGGYGFTGSVASDIKTSDYWYSGFYHRAGETSMQWPIYGENKGFGLISANANKQQHEGEMIIFNSAGRLSTNGNASWPAMTYNTQGFSGGDNDAHNFTISGQLKGGDNNPCSGVRLYGGSAMTAGEIRTYGLKTT